MFTVHANPSEKRIFPKTLVKPEELEKLFVFVWMKTPNVFFTVFFLFKVTNFRLLSK